MGAEQSKPVPVELSQNSTKHGVQEQVDCISPTIVPHEAETEHILHSKSSPATACLPLRNQASSTIPISPSSLSPTTSIEYQTKKTDDEAFPVTAHSVVASDDEEDLITSLRKHRRTRAAAETYTVIRHDAWESLDIDWWSHFKGSHYKSHKAGKPSAQPKTRKRPNPHDGQIKVGTSRNKLQAQGQHPNDGQHRTGIQKPKPQTEGTRPAHRRQNVGGQKPKPLAKSPHQAKKSNLTPFRVNRRRFDRNLPCRFDTGTLALKLQQGRHAVAWLDQNAAHHSNTEPLISRPQQDRSVIAEIDRCPIRTSNNELTASKKQEGGNIVARFDQNLVINSTTEQNALRAPKERRVIPTISRNIGHYPDSDTEPTTPIDSGRRHSTSRIGGGNFTNTRIASRSREQRPELGGFHAAIGDPISGQLSRTPLVVNQNQVVDFFENIGGLPVPRSQSEEREAALIQEFKRQQQQRPREHVVPDLKWGYAVKCIENADMILDEEDLNARAITVRTFADREKANEFIDKNTSAEKCGGLEAFVSRTATLEGPERFLKVDMVLSNGDHHLMWVERGMVVLRNLNEKQRRQVQWAPNPRPTFPHYIVTCDLITYETCPVSRCEQEDEDDDDATSLSDHIGQFATSGLAVNLGIEKLPLTTFTIREMANAYASKLFLERSTVHKQFAASTDDQWWRQNVLCAHKAAESRASRPDGLYEASMEAYDMNSLLGWDQIVVHVHEVDDVTGPVNF